MSRCALRSTSGARPASICVSSASPRQEARAGSWRRRRLWAWRMASRPAAGNRKGPEAEASRTADDSAFRALGEALTPNSRFLWTLDGEGRFGVSHPALVAAVGANAPRRGELVEAFVRRAELDGGEALARALGERRTFSGLRVEWPLPEPGRRRRVALSAAPLFGRHREFLGYRGFGVLGQEIRGRRGARGRLFTGAAGRRPTAGDGGIRTRARTAGRRPRTGARARRARRRADRIGSRTRANGCVRSPDAARGFARRGWRASAPRRCPKRSSPKPRLRRTRSQPKARPARSRSNPISNARQRMCPKPPIRLRRPRCGCRQALRDAGRRRAPCAERGSAAA